MCPVCLATAAAIIAGKATAPGGFAVLVAHTFGKKNPRRNVPVNSQPQPVSDAPSINLNQKEDRDGYHAD